ncbi:MAG: SGNH/GDSL hydrolase family protein [Lentimonas sp.]
MCVFPKCVLIRFIGVGLAMHLSCAQSAQAFDVLLLGDSLINGRERLAKPLVGYFREHYTLAGAGYCSFVDSNGPADGNMAGFYGNDGWLVNKGGVDAIGMDITDVTGWSNGLELQVSVKSEVNVIDVYYKAQPDGGRFLVYNGDALLTVVDTRTSYEETRVHSFDWPDEPTSQILKIVVEDAGIAGVCLAGVNFRVNGAGFRIHEMGTGGLPSVSFTSVDRNNWVASVAELDPELVCILLGTNDHAYNRAPFGFKENIEELISRIRQAKENMEILLLSTTDNGLEGQVYDVLDYRNALADIAIAQNVGFVDLWAQLGDYADANAEGLYQDEVHPNSLGGLHMRDASISVLEFSDSTDVELIKLTDRDSVLSTTCLNCEVVDNDVALRWKRYPGVLYTLKKAQDFDSWGAVPLPETRATQIELLLNKESTACFWRMELSYPLLWN